MSFCQKSENFSCSRFQVTTTTKTIREVQYLGPDGQPLDLSQGPPPVHPRLSTSSAPGHPQNYEPYNGPGQPAGYDPRFAAGQGYGDYEQYGPGPNGGQPPGGVGNYANYAEYPHRAPTPPSPSDRSASPPPQHREPGKQNGKKGLLALGIYCRHETLLCFLAYAVCICTYKRKLWPLWIMTSYGHSGE